jgi:hypothetical protein
MRALISIVLALLLYSSVANAGTIEIRRRPYTAISTLTAASFNGGVWTGWISMGDFTSICFRQFHDYTANTGVTMRCETSELTTTTADSGYDITSIDLAAGAATVSGLTYTRTTGADSRWTQCVDYVPGNFINCKFDDLAGGSADDLLTVEYQMVTP